MHLTLTLACGPDEILARVLKEQAPSITSWLSSIFRHSYNTGAVPPDWNKALVTAWTLLFQNILTNSIISETFL